MPNRIELIEVDKIQYKKKEKIVRLVFFLFSSCYIYTCNKIHQKFNNPTPLSLN